MSESNELVVVPPKPKQQRRGPKPVRLGYLGVGGMGCNTTGLILEEICATDNAHLSIKAINTDGPQLLEFFLQPSEKFDANGDQITEGFLSSDEAKKEKNRQSWLKHLKNPEKPNGQFSYLQLGETGQGAGGKPEACKALMEEEFVKNDLEGFLHPDGELLDALIIVAGLGKGTGTGGAPVIAEMVKALPMSVTAIVTMPLRMEGDKRYEQAKTARDLMLTLVPTIVLYNQGAPRKDVPLDEMWLQINRASPVKILESKRKMIQSVGYEMNTDIADERSNHDVGNHIIFASEVWHEDTQPIETFTKDVILADPYQNILIWQKVTRITGTFTGPWTAEQMEAVTKPLEDGILERLRPELIVNFGANNKRGGKEKWVALEGVAKEAPDEPVVEVRPSAAPSPNHTKLRVIEQTDSGPTLVSPSKRLEEKQPEPREPRSEPIWIDDASGKNHEVKVTKSLSSRWWNSRKSTNNTSYEELEALAEDICEQTGKRPFIPTRLSQQAQH